MACFLVPVGEAIVTTVAQKVMEKREQKNDTGEKDEGKAESRKLTWSRRLGWLNKMLWGGALLLAIEHVWHGEVVPWPPFLTAMENSADVGPMLHEMATIGGTMAVAITVVWGIMVAIAEVKARAVPAPKATPVGGGTE